MFFNETSHNKTEVLWVAGCLSIQIFTIPSGENEWATIPLQLHCFHIIYSSYCHNRSNEETKTSNELIQQTSIVCVSTSSVPQRCILAQKLLKTHPCSIGWHVPSLLWKHTLKLIWNQSHMHHPAAGNPHWFLTHTRGCKSFTRIARPSWFSPLKYAMRLRAFFFFFFLHI